MRIKEKHRRDFEAYVRWGRISTLDPVPYRILPVGETPSIAAFFQYDSTGINPSECNDPELLCLAWKGKIDLNRQIKDWSAGYIVCGGRSWLEEVQQEFDWLPDWVWEAIVEQHYAKS